MWVPLAPQGAIPGAKTIPYSAVNTVCCSNGFRTARPQCVGVGAANLRAGHQFRPTALSPHRISGRRRRLLAGCSPAPTTAANGSLEKLLAASSVAQLYRTPGLSQSAAQSLLQRAHTAGLASITGISMEICYNVSITSKLESEEAEKLLWLLAETYEPERLTAESSVGSLDSIVEVGPRLSFSTAWSANAVSICVSCGVGKVDRIEQSRRYVLEAEGGLSEQDKAAFAALVHDRMTEQVFSEPLHSFKVDNVPEPVREVPLLEEGVAALKAIDEELGLAFDDWDLQHYYSLFAEDLKRNPTTVELFDLAQSNSEHCRHWFFSGAISIDGTPQPHTLFSLVKDTYKANPNNSVIAFKDNSSAIEGAEVTPLLPESPGAPGPLAPVKRTWDLLLTAETHNFPCAVAPFPGAETGSGGRIRDTHATGTGSIMGAASAGYCVGNLQIPFYTQPWEDQAAEYPSSLAPPLQILLEASDGASDYGNKFGEPLITGYTRAFGQRLPSGERREWIKPIMFSGGFGQIDRAHHEKYPPEVGMLVVKIGGPAYRIGIGGGAASSVPGGTRGGEGDLDFNAVQRGDAEMSQKLWRVVRTCVELGDSNPIVQIHDQGAGGNCNVVKEIIYPLGAEVDIRAVQLGDATMSVLEIWGAEYQENDCLLIRAKHRALLEDICARERACMQVIGTCNGSGRIVLKDPQAPPDTPVPVDLDLETVLGDLPQKSYSFPEYTTEWATPVVLPEGESVEGMLGRVLRMPAIASKRFLTTKVDRCVTGLVAQQQCVGPYQLPLADVAVIAQAHQGPPTGLATAIGEQPIKGLLAPAAMARLALAEALLNLVCAPVTSLPDVRASVNWMHAAKLKAEGAAMYRTAEALRDAMVALGVACDGGKDSLSMAANAAGESVMAPGNLVISAYVACTDVRRVLTPDLKAPGNYLLHVDLGKGQRRLGGSALAQAYNQVGSECPDVGMPELQAAFETTQQLLKEGRLVSAHDISDGGAVVTLLEMAFAGLAGLKVDLPAAEGTSVAATLMAEEPGLILEVSSEDCSSICDAYSNAGVPCTLIGATVDTPTVSISVGGEEVAQGPSAEWRDVWEQTAFALERLQAAPELSAAEQQGLKYRVPPKWRLSWLPEWGVGGAPDSTPPADLERPLVAVLREEGSNGDREMAAAVHAAGMQPWDVTMSDILAGRITLDRFQAIVFVGGFSYADTLDSGKGWASAMRFSPEALAQFEAFATRTDTLSLGVCNGCQLMALMGWVPRGLDGAPLGGQVQPRFIHNASGRFECRWAQVSVLPSPAVMLDGMEGSTMGIWVAHGEGRCHFPDELVEQMVLENDLAPVRYADTDGRMASMYPSNPNGSPHGIAALCSADGRHLAMMPHPERCYLGWQVPWSPEGTGVTSDGPGPWLRLFQNARTWLVQHQS